MKTWTDIGSDVDWEQYGGKWAKADPAHPGRYYVIEFVNMEEACGSDNEGHDKYLCEIKQVDLNEIPDDELKSAFDCCGYDLDDPDYQSDMCKVEACASYGISAPMECFGSNTYASRLRAKARRYADELMADEALVQSQLDQTVNGIGSTARDFGQGNTMAGLDRWKVEQKTRALKVNFKRVPSDDPIAFTHGFQTGCAGGPFPADESDLAPAWIEGHTLGLKVRNGEEDIRNLNLWVTPEESDPTMALMARLSGNL